MALGAGLALNNTLAALRGLGGGAGDFVRTPKNAGSDGASQAGPGYITASGWLLWAEAAMVLYFSVVVAVAVQWRMWLGLPVALLFLGGYAYLVLLAFGQSLRRRRAERLGLAVAAQS
jgi:hypothetical protein